MDLYAKSQGLKHNFGKVHGCFRKNPGFHPISRFIELFFYRKTRGISLQRCGPNLRLEVHGSMQLH
jgi:hypothetical protein